MSERRFFELRTYGRQLRGIAISYNDIATLPFGKERFEAGAFGDVSTADVILTVAHSRERPIARTQGGGLELCDGPNELSVRAQLPKTQEADDVLSLVEASVLRGFSIEFEATKERTEGQGEGAVRVVTGANLRGLSVVDRPAFGLSVVAARNVAARNEERQRHIIWL